MITYNDKTLVLIKDEISTLKSKVMFVNLTYLAHSVHTVGLII